MSLCCPPRLGCNAPGHDEPCVLDLCRAISRREPAAATMLDRWQTWQDAIASDSPRSEQRFLRRAYERAREAAMGVLVMRLARARRGPGRRRGSAGRRTGPSWSRPRAEAGSTEPPVRRR
jgi:hypothetical protein